MHVAGRSALQSLRHAASRLPCASPATLMPSITLEPTATGANKLTKLQPACCLRSKIACSHYISSNTGCHAMQIQVRPLILNSPGLPQVRKTRASRGRSVSRRQQNWTFGQSSPRSRRAAVTCCRADLARAKFVLAENPKSRFPTIHGRRLAAQNCKSHQKQRLMRMPE